MSFMLDHEFPVGQVIAVIKSPRMDPGVLLPRLAFQSDDYSPPLSRPVYPAGYDRAQHNGDASPSST